MSVQSDIAAAAARYGIPASLALAVAQRESGYNQSARGAAGEVGVFQLMPGTARELGVNPYDLGENIDGGLRYLRQQFDRFGDWATALLAYNAGPGAVSRGAIPDSSRAYAGDVLATAGPLTQPAVSWPALQVRQLELESGAGAWVTLAVVVGAAWLLLRR